VAVFVSIFEDPDFAARFPVIVHAQRIIPHLNDPKLPIRSPIECDRVNDGRFARNQLDLHSFRDMKRSQRLLW
jgi:hypothetical protein